MLSYNPQKVEIQNVSIGVTTNNSDYATETTLNTQNSIITGLNNNNITNFALVNGKLDTIRNDIGSSKTHLANIDIKLQKQTTIDSKLGNIRDKLPSLTAVPTYFEFTGLSTNESAVSRLIQNTTGSPVYITEIRIYGNNGTTGMDYNGWFHTNSCEHIVDVCSSNNNYPTDSEREFLNCQDFQEIISRYKTSRQSVGHGTVTSSFRNLWMIVEFNPPVLCENNNYVRLYRNGDTTHMTNHRICVIGYY